MAVYRGMGAGEFTAWFEGRVRETIGEHALIAPGYRVLVAASGGKDSSVLLHVLRRLGYDVSAVAIDEGIAGYRPACLAHLGRLCDRLAIPLAVRSFAEAFGAELDALLAVEGRRPCTWCGILRRKLLEREAAAYDVVATGHNADDEAQSVLMNLSRAALLSRGGPATEGAAFTRRVKPLYFLSEKEVLVYALLHGLATPWNECPYAARSLRAGVREALNRLEARRPGARARLLRWHLRRRPSPSGSSPRACRACGEASAGERCRACILLEEKA